MPFKMLGLSDPLVRGILATGYTAPTEIQSQVIPCAIEGKDIIGCAQTGTGKTAAFVLPILNRLTHERDHKGRYVKALILTPTRELALQIHQCIIDYGRFLSLRTLTIYGGVNIGGQLSQLSRGVDIVVATPGRLIDHINRRTVDLRNVEVLVLDEADRMLDMGFINDVRKIISYTPQNRQTMLFSATIPPEIHKLASGVMQSPKVIQVGRAHNPIETITQHIYPVSKENKMQMLLYMLQKGGMYSVLIFSRTKHGADRISKKLLHADIKSMSLHSDRTQSQRQRALEGFKNGKFQVLVATDIAARGIDVEGISHVINFDVPSFAEDYVHRIGRTGRATAKGDAITFVARDEEKYVRQIEKFIGKKIKYEKCEGFVPTPLSPQEQQEHHEEKTRNAERSRSPQQRNQKRSFHPDQKRSFHPGKKTNSRNKRSWHKK
ncbi:MAG: DEAD/DEAH box helicase [Planctomycetaceae bacterium]|nr:DEAD/DEAH box helicase [Planctomycetaceae bacterium]